MTFWNSLFRLTMQRPVRLLRLSLPESHSAEPYVIARAKDWRPPRRQRQNTLQGSVEDGKDGKDGKDRRPDPRRMCF